MKAIFARQPFPEDMNNSIFMAGPTPRSPDVKSWRPDAIALFFNCGYDGTLLIPEGDCFEAKVNYDDQVGWEEEGLKKASCIMFWIPREMKTMPALTTNDEWGTWKNSGKVVLGVPFDAEKCRYQIYYANKLGIPFANTLDHAVKNAIKMAMNFRKV